MLPRSHSGQTLGLRGECDPGLSFCDHHHDMVCSAVLSRVRGDNPLTVAVVSEKETTRQTARLQSWFPDRTSRAEGSLVTSALL